MTERGGARRGVPAVTLSAVVSSMIVACSTSAGSKAGTTTTPPALPPASAPRQSAPTIVTGSNAVAVGTYPVASVVLPLQDVSRPTVSHGRVVANLRTLTTTVWYPTSHAGPDPLIVFAHGFGVGITPYERICQVWASAGYVVAAPAFPLTDRAVAGAAIDEGDMVNQPADVRFVADAVLAESASTKPSPLRSRVKADEVALAGHSDGADTALAAGYLSPDRGPRLRGVLADAPDPLPGIEDSAPLRSTLPLLLVHGTADTIVSFAGSVTVTRQLRTPGWFLELLGADHLPPIEGGSSWTPLFDTVTTDFFNTVLKGAGSGALAGVVGPSPFGHLVTLPT